jgi:hypothetical protein
MLRVECGNQDIVLPVVEVHAGSRDLADTERPRPGIAIAWPIDTDGTQAPLAKPLRVVEARVADQA